MNWADAWSRAVRELPAHTPRQFARWYRAVYRMCRAKGYPIPTWLEVAP